MGWSYWVLITCNIALPQLMWIRKLRLSIPGMFIMSLIINSGMWFERFVIVVTSLYRDYLPSSWGTYKATRIDYGTYLGTWGLFTVLFFLFIRLLPMIPMSELRMLLPATKHSPHGPEADVVSQEAH
jgi:molybdopterin-containing oxidoreductase family membrane subunit